MHRRTVLALGLLLAGSCVAARVESGETSVVIRRVELIVPGASALDPFLRPLALVADTTRGVVLVADAGNHRIVNFDRSWRSRGSVALDASRSSEPRALAVDARGRIFVADALQRDFEVMNARGAFIASFLPELPVEPEEVFPSDIQIGRSGRIYLLFAGARPGLCITDGDGVTLTAFGFESAEGGLFRAPMGLAVSSDESRIAVVDPTAEKSVLVFDAEGVLLESFGEHGEGQGTFSLAADVTWGPEGTLWITDTLRHSISVFQEDGTILGRLGGFGDGPGQFKYPVGCAFLAAGRIVVLERANARCQVLEVEVTLPSRADEHLGLRGSDMVGAALQPDKGGSWR